MACPRAEAKGYYGAPAAFLRHTTPSPVLGLLGGMGLVLLGCEPLKLEGTSE